ncbi:vitamin B12 ABC transporter, ATPase component BtuD [Bacillus sp. JCM 19045]|nr:vitamin B12 ABC transporter, ATPase component BtuD [Bacillus sp. JCM 19045]
MIKAENLSVKKGDQWILKNVSFAAEKGDFIGILGANGSGKTTLLKALTGTIKSNNGSVTITGERLNEMSFKARAKKMAVLSQASDVTFQATVVDTIMLGRYAHLRGLFMQESQQDRQIVDQVMKDTKTIHLKNRDLLSLSGGERQRVWLARALAQEPDCLFLDEPTNHLDLAHQVSLLDHLRLLADEKQMTVICILHDVNMASFYCNKVVLLNEGQVQRSGLTQTILNEAELQKLYGTTFYSWLEPSTACKQFSIKPGWLLNNKEGNQ